MSKIVDLNAYREKVLDANDDHTILQEVVDDVMIIIERRLVVENVLWDCLDTLELSLFAQYQRVEVKNVIEDLLQNLLKIIEKKEREKCRKKPSK